MSTEPGVEKVLVTGASGYIATHIVQQLQQAGYKVRGTVRSLSNPKKVDPLRKLCPDAAHELELVEADLTNEECWKDAVQGCSHVIHTASPFPDKSPKDENVVIKPAVEGTTRVLQACKDAGGVKRVVLTSSVAAVTDLTVTNKEPITEETWRNLDSKMEDAYGKSKALAEKAAWDFIEKLPAESKFELAAINPSLVLGPVLCGVPGTSIEVIRRLLERDPPAMPRINFPLCDVRDVAKAHIIAMTHPEAAGHRHLIAPYNMWFHEMADVLREEFKDKGYKPPSMIAPSILLKMVSWFDSTVKYILPLQGQVSTLSKHRFLEVLDIKPYDPKESLIDMAYSCIDRGFIAKKKQYVNPKAQQTTEGASASS